MDNKALKMHILEEVSGSAPAKYLGKAHYAVSGARVHVRCKSKASHRASYPFNINPNTLTADFELWICGTSDGWYLIPIDVIRGIYDDPDSYLDYLHPEIRVVTVDAIDSNVSCGRGGKRLNFKAYRNARLANHL